MRGRTIVPLPPLRLEQMLPKVSLEPTAPKLSEPVSSASSLPQTSSDEARTTPQQVNSFRPKSLFGLFALKRKNMSPSPPVSENPAVDRSILHITELMLSDTPLASPKVLTTPGQSGKQETLPTFSVPRTPEEPAVQEIPDLLPTLKENNESYDSSKLEFTEILGVTDVFQVHAQESVPESKIESASATETESEVDSVSDMPFERTPRSQSDNQTSTHREGLLDSFNAEQVSNLRRGSRHASIVLPNRHSSTSSMSSVSPFLFNESQQNLKNLQSIKSTVSPMVQVLSDPEGETKEEVVRRELEEYVEEKEGLFSAEMKKVLFFYLDSALEQVRVVNLCGMGLGDDDLEDCCRLFQAFPLLEDLNLSSNHFSFFYEGETKDFFTRNQCSVRRLDLSRNPIGAGHLSKTFINFLLSYVNLTDLDMSMCKLTDSDVSSLTSHIQYLRVLKTLGLRNNSISDVGAVSIAKLLKECEEIEMVDASGNHMTKRTKKVMSEFMDRIELSWDVNCCCFLF